MRYLIALLCPPLAVLISGKGLAGIINAAVYVAAWITLFFGFGFLLYALCAAHACMEVSNFYSDRRTREMERAITAAVAASTAPESKPIQSVLIEKQPDTPPAPKGYDAKKDLWVIE